MYSEIYGASQVVCKILLIKIETSLCGNINMFVCYVLTWFFDCKCFFNCQIFVNASPRYQN